MDHADHPLYSRIHLQKTQALKKIAFFDFDGTITTHDTLLEFIKYSRGTTRFYLGFLLNSPFLVAYKAGILSNQKAKERILTHFFRKISLTEFNQLGSNFVKEALPGLLRPKAIHEIDRLKQAGFEVVIVSASAENWLKDWTKQNGLQLIASRMEIRKECITGKLLERNCHGEEKVNRIRQQYSLVDYRDIYCYGDTSGDKPMLSLGTISFYKPFR